MALGRQVGAGVRENKAFFVAVRTQRGVTTRRATLAPFLALNLISIPETRDTGAHWHANVARERRPVWHVRRRARHLWGRRSGLSRGPRRGVGHGEKLLRELCQHLGQRPHPLENQVCSQHSLHEVFISKFAELSGIVKGRLEALHARHCPGVQVSIHP